MRSRLPPVEMMYAVQSQVVQSQDAFIMAKGMFTHTASPSDKVIGDHSFSVRAGLRVLIVHRLETCSDNIAVFECTLSVLAIHL